MLYLAADHRGFELKELLKKMLTEHRIAFEDCGAHEYNKGDDYTDFAIVAGEKIAANPSEHRGIFICGSGHGMDIAANKFKGIRAALCWNTDVAKQSREHDGANVLVLPADWLDEAATEEIVMTWLGTNFSNEERHARRLEKIKHLEDGRFCRCS